MLKLVFCVLLAVAAAEPEASPEAKPDVLYSHYGLPYATNWLSPAAITRQDSILNSSPFLYSAPLTYSHLIKKRSAPLILPHSYISPTTYAASANLVTSHYTSGTPYFTSAPWISSPITYSHFIKKRAAPLAYSSYNYYTPSAYTAGSPYLASSYGAAIPYYGSSPLITSPYAYTQFIKK